MRRTHSFVPGLTLLAFAPVALASFHVMQIEQVIGGVGGSNTRQAIQLRMRNDFQNQVQLSRIRAWNAAGASPVLIVDFDAPVSVSVLGSRVLSATPGFATGGQGPTPDFVMDPIPAAYLAAGKLTFEDDSGNVLWSLCWGGASYTGTNTGGFTNDSDGNFGPCFSGPLPTAAAQAVKFRNGPGSPSTTNAADYELTPGPAAFTNNAGASALVVELFQDGFESSPTLAPAAKAAAVARPRKHAHDHGTGFFPDPTLSPQGGH